MPFLVRLPGAWQARAHGSCGHCLHVYCPCNADGMVSASWADRKFGGERVAKMLAENWCFRFRARALARRDELELTRSREAISQYRACKASQG